ncbi:Myb-like DNA-binding domain containing protein [Trichomonas vaginalis G3]|uniref:Myb-like DNA-binding domain containing protein n=1 Tax=Trichomonas vaginalis (strain ATCC PRA-98 / G3) TaxID=412133 RepID=A2DWM9_TRIV3|nr:RNA polymerase II transcription regulator recruiting protein [Trichomonas vaginalis G3]EAY15214.1 Myb-like DNA-binding domain containing protein [Trichomonas vaginalis G3]KAI5550632.1 RNA polymerase II transcription regulator recruiting protein [Trichomonas vaginalis G3]|eukprot:XP_001327437.1 Myb-like DNA-binding domain containing protein [Trichomonas vaginalis G3]
MIASTSMVTKNKFTLDDDDLLRSLVDEHGKDWNLVAEHMKTKNARQCKDRYEKYLAPHLNLSPFTIEEDIQLLTLYKKFGCRWIKISELMPGRSDVAIKARFRLLKRHGKTIQNLKKEKNQSLKNKEPKCEPGNTFYEQLENIFGTCDDDFVGLLC